VIVGLDSEDAGLNPGLIFPYQVSFGSLGCDNFFRNKTVRTIPADPRMTKVTATPITRPKNNEQGCQMEYLHTKNTNLRRYILEGLG
jgi:hypothetical protein